MCRLAHRYRPRIIICYTRVASVIGRGLCMYVQYVCMSAMVWCWADPRAPMYSAVCAVCPFVFRDPVLCLNG